MLQVCGRFFPARPVVVKRYGGGGVDSGGRGEGDRMQMKGVLMIASIKEEWDNISIKQKASP